MIDVLILALATWRMASLLATEEGPYGVFAKLRAKAGVWYDDYSNSIASNELAKGLMCVWCNSVWIGLFWTVFYFIFRDAAPWLALPFALSAGAVIVETIAGGEGAE